LAAGLSFPVATLAKSAKMVPVMIGSLILGGASFGARQVIQAAMIVGGTSIVTMAESGGKKKGANTSKGIAFICLSLFCDGLVGGIQKRMKAQLKEAGVKEKAYDMMFCTNAWMTVAAVAMAAVMSELKPGMAFLKANPEMGSKIVQFAVCGAMGQVSIYYLIANFDSVVCTAITTTRKLVSVLVSLAESGPEASLPPMGWAGIAVAAVGIGGEIV